MAGAWSNVHVRFPFENKAGDQESDHGLVSGGMFLCESGVFVLWDAAGRLYAYDNSHLDVVCIVQSHSKLPIVDACQSNTLLFTLQQCGTVNSYFTSPSQLLTENKSLDAGTVAQAVGEAMGMCTCNGRFLAIHGKRTRSVLVVQTDTLVALQVLHGQADFVVACLASSGNLLVTSNLTGLLNVWTCSNKAFSLEYTMCALGFSLPFSSSPSITAVTVRKLVQANPTSLVVLTSLGECVLARDFDKVNELVVDVVLAHRVMDIDFVHECLYVLREDGAVLILDHYMTERTLVQASNDRVLIDQLNLVPGSCEGDLLICMGGNVVQLYNSRGEVVATQTQQPVRNTARPLAMLVAPNRKCRTRYHTVICQQTSPGVLEASCFSHTIPIADCLVNDNCNAYTCLEYVEHQNGFFCLAGKGNGQLDVYNLCLPLLTRNHNGSDGEIKLELHKSLPSLHFGAIQAIFVCGDDGNGSTRPSLCCTVDKNHHQVVVLSCKDFTVLHRFAGHQSPVCNVRWNWPFLYVQVANGKTFVWNLVNGMLERLLQHPPALVEIRLQLRQAYGS
ncbi:hypothetical protein BASA81_003356 [Batrachochytrium salamandrivorans]|nr:hypothetical protein BASA81_003356 [Batrachochytrium salamandrivorans]